MPKNSLASCNAVGESSPKMQVHKLNKRHLLCLLALLVIFVGIGIRVVRRNMAESVDLKASKGVADSPNSGSSLPDKKDRRDSGKFEARGGPQYQLYGDDGELNFEILDIAGISRDRRDELSDIINQSREQAIGAMAERAVKENIEGQNGRVSYHIPSSPEQAENTKAELERAITSSFGKGAAQRLMPYLVNPKYLAGWGSLDLTLSKVFYNQDGLSGSAITYTLSDPKTGGNLATGPLSADEVYRKYYGSLLWDKLHE